MLFGGDGTHFFARKTIRDYKKENSTPFLNNFFHQSDSSTSELEPKKLKLILLWYNRVETPLVDTVNQNFIHILIFYTFSPH